MPYHLPGDPPADDEDKLLMVYRERIQEREVRLTAQSILTDHLQSGDPMKPLETFWENTSTWTSRAATLINFDLSAGTVRNATFKSATFTGHAIFELAIFTDTADSGRPTSARKRRA